MALTDSEKRIDKKEKPLTKVIVRRLPPSMDQQTFLNQVSPIPEYNYIYTAKGDSKLGEFAFTRVYINFINPNDIYDFKERFDNYVFLDSRGHEYPAVVEFAPFQKIPKKRGKTRQDPKCGTIESDPIFQDFLESLNKPKEQEEKPEFSLQLTSENKNDITTPLLEYIKNKRAQKLRIREVRREERKRREFDKRKDRYDDKKKIFDERNSLRNVSNTATPKSDPNKEEKNDTVTPKIEEKVEKVYEKSFYKSRDKKYEEKRYDEKRKDIKPRYPKKEYQDRDYKRQDEYREREYRSKYDDFKKDEKNFPKKVKKYSERREERKLEVQKSEQRKSDVDNKKVLKEATENPKQETAQNPESQSGKIEMKKKEDVPKSDTVSENIQDNKKDGENVKTQAESKIKESDSQSQRRIRNKDRPTIAIYRPGMLSKRKQNETDSSENKNDSK